MFFNLIGFAMFVVCGALAGGIARVLGGANRDLQVLVAGALLVVVDLMIRSWREVRPFERGGGTIMFLPVWLWGIVLLGMSVVALVRGA